MAKETEKPTKAQEWLEKITRALKVKENWRNRFRVLMGYDYWEGAQRPGNVPENEWITINKIYSNLQAELPTLYSNDPFFYVKLSKSYSPNPMDIALFEQRGRIRQAMLNYLKKELKLKKKVRLSILDGYFQFGVNKVHYYSEEQKNPNAGMPIMDDSGLPMLGDDGNYIAQPDTIPANEAYVITRVHPDDFLWDEDAGPLEDDWSWMAQRIRRPMEEVRKDKRYNRTARRSVKPTEIREDQIQADRELRKKGSVVEGNDKGPDPEIVITWEIYDLKAKEWMTVSPGYDDFLISPEPVPVGIEKHPFAFLVFTHRDDSVYPLPPVSQWLDPQREYCELRSKILVHRKRFNRKYSMYSGGFEDAQAEMAKLAYGEDGTVLMQNLPAQTVYPIQDAPLDQNHIQEVMMLRGDFEELAVGSNQRGGGAGVDSATEAGIIEKRTVMREGDKLSAVIDFVTDIGAKLDQLVQAHITQDQAVKVTGPQGEYWESVKAMDYESIAGEYEYSVNTGATTPQLPEIERAQWIAFLGVIANAPQLAMSKTLLKKTAEMHHIDDENLIEEIFQIAKAMMTGQLAGPGQGGSAPGGPDMMTMQASSQGGMAAGMNNIRGGAQ